MVPLSFIFEPKFLILLSCSRECWLDSNEKTQKLFGYGNHSTMLFEYQNVKIGFMALIDEYVFTKLNDSIREKLKKNSLEDKDNSSSASAIEYVDFIAECDKLSKQLRLCGANIIVVLTNMSDVSEQKLVREAADLDLVFSGSQNDLASGTDIKKIQVGSRWIIKSGTNFDCVSLVSLNLDELNSNKILDVAITRYLIEQNWTCKLFIDSFQRPHDKKIKLRECCCRWNSFLSPYGHYFFKHWN